MFHKLLNRSNVISPLPLMKDRQTPMRLDFFIEGPLLRFVFVVFFMGIAVRIAFFLKAIIASAKDKGCGLACAGETLESSPEA